MPVGGGASCWDVGRALDRLARRRMGNVLALLHEPRSSECTRRSQQFDAAIVKQILLGVSSDSRANSKVGAWTTYGPFGALYFLP